MKRIKRLLNDYAGPIGIGLFFLSMYLLRDL